MIGKYTNISGGNRFNSCEFDNHGRLCEHGDCSCKCHDLELTCQVCNEDEATHQYSNETGYFCCYGCWLAQRDVTP